MLSWKEKRISQSSYMTTHLDSVITCMRPSSTILRTARYCPPRIPMGNTRGTRSTRSTMRSPRRRPRTSPRSRWDQPCGATSPSSSSASWACCYDLSSVLRRHNSLDGDQDTGTTLGMTPHPPSGAGASLCNDSMYKACSRWMMLSRAINVVQTLSSFVPSGFFPLPSHSIGNVNP